MDPSQAPDDTSVNGVVDSDSYEDDGEPWDCDRGFPEEIEDEEDEECEFSS